MKVHRLALVGVLLLAGCAGSPIDALIAAYKPAPSYPPGGWQSPAPGGTPKPYPPEVVAVLERSGLAMPSPAATEAAKAPAPSATSGAPIAKLNYKTVATAAMSFEVLDDYLVVVTPSADPYSADAATSEVTLTSGPPRSRIGMQTNTTIPKPTSADDSANRMVAETVRAGHAVSAVETVFLGGVECRKLVQLPYEGNARESTWVFLMRDGRPYAFGLSVESKDKDAERFRQGFLHSIETFRWNEVPPSPKPSAKPTATPKPTPRPSASV